MNQATHGRREHIRRILRKADSLHAFFGTAVHDRVTASVFDAARRVTDKAVERAREGSPDRDLKIDRILTSRLFGFPVMLTLLAVVFWVTIEGANLPSSFLASLLMEDGGLKAWFALHLGWNEAPTFLGVSLYDLLMQGFSALHAPGWLSGFLVDGVYLGLAWVVSVMLPPMAIFFPLFTLLEDFGVLPRIAFNLDRFFRAVGAHGKQALTMAMGFGCNAAGVIACRIINSPRERLIAILTNNFVPCNGRWPTLIMMASLFLAAALPAGLAALVSIGALTGATLFGIGVTLLISLFLSRTLLRGVASSFMLELPPYRPPQPGRILYTSLIDRTWFVLRRAVICAAPAGGLIWILGAIPAGDSNLFALLATGLDPVGRALGLDGVILLAFIFAIPANEIVVPTIIMGYMNLSRMTELENPAMLFADNGWTALTAVCVMLFSLLHYPCTTTTLTIWAETRSVKWTLLSNLIPLVMAVAVCFLVAQVSAMFR
jgi:ferrous iron transport protein B